MKVLVAHNAYQQRGGEDSVVDDEVALLRSRGAEVALMQLHNDEIAGMGKLALAGRTLWSRAAGREMAALCRRLRPDVVHVHNSFPLMSPAIHWAAQEAGVPVVQTHPGRHGAPLPAPAQRRGAGGVPQARGAAGAGAHLRRAHLPGAGDADRDDRGRLQRRRGRRAAPRDGRLEAPRRAGQVLRQGRQRHAEEGLRGRLRRAHLQADQGLLLLRLPREPRRQLRAAHLRQLLAQVPRARGLPVRAAQLPAAGLLHAQPARAGRAAPPRRGARHRRQPQRQGQHAGAPPRPAPSRRAPGPAPGQRPGRRGGPAHRARAPPRRPLRPPAGPRPARPAQPAGHAAARRRRRPHLPGRPPPPAAWPATAASRCGRPRASARRRNC